MIISINQSGGYAGVNQNLATIDTTRLNAATARQIEQLVQQLTFFHLPEKVTEQVGADMLRYEITVEDINRRHTVIFDDDGSPQTAQLRQLVNLVRQQIGQ
jgi:hypothetical protein